MPKFHVSYAGLLPVFVNVDVEAESEEAAWKIPPPQPTEWRVLRSSALAPDATTQTIDTPSGPQPVEGALFGVEVTWVEPVLPVLEVTFLEP